ncbi:MAG: hypothetical protein WA152_01615 [Microgenomates group bacterium]
MLENRNLHIENDKTYCPYLLGCSFNGLLKFEGSTLQNRILYFEFSPKEKALELIDQLQTKTEPHIPARDLFEAISTFWKKVESSRNGEIKNGEST